MILATRFTFIVEKTCTFTQKWLHHLLLIMSCLITIETDHYWTWLKMRYPLGENSENLMGLASTPLVCPRVKDLICSLISIKFYGCKNELHKRVASVLIWGRGTRNYNQFTFIYLSNGSFFWNCLKLLRFSRFVFMVFRKSCFGKILVLCECL